MTTNGEVNRVNYALIKHHREMLRQKIDPRLIEQIEVAQNPSLNYKNAFKSVYQDELEKTIEDQQAKRQQQQRGQNYLYPTESPLGRSKSNEYLLYNPVPLQNSTNTQSTAQLTKNNYRNTFTDYQEERNRKLDGLISKNISGAFLFQEQDEYQKKRQQESQFTKSALQQQLLMKENRKLQQIEDHNREVEEVKQNRMRQMEMEQYRNMERKQERHAFGNEVKQQIQFQRAKKGRKSYFEYQNIARHNPITNPIEYHIDNPYILSQYQTRAYNYQ